MATLSDLRTVLQTLAVLLLATPALAPVAWAQPTSQRTPYLQLPFSSDERTNRSLSRIDEVLGPITGGVFDASQPRGRVYDAGGAVYNVQAPQFGAVGDGVTDDTVAIQKAITTAASGGTIFFPGPATYIISDALSYSSNQRWVATGGATIKLKASSIGNIAASVEGNTLTGIIQPSTLTGISNVEFVDIRLDGNKSNNATTNSGDGIQLLNCQACAVRGGYITAVPRDGIGIGERSSGTTSNVTIAGVTLYDVGLAGVNGGSGIAVTSGDNIQILDNYVASSERDGIDVEPNSGNTVRGITIRGGMYRDNTLNGVSVYPPAAGDLTVREIAIDGVQAHENTERGFWFSTGSSYRNEGMIVRGCTAYRNGKEGFYFVDQERVVLVGNYAIENGQTSANTYSGFLIDRTGFSVIGNQAWDAQGTKTQKYGFEEEASATGNVFVGNTATAHGTAQFYYQGTAYASSTLFTTGNSAAWQNVYSANATIDFDNIVTPPDCNDKTITVTGAADGDRVIVGLRNGAVVADGFVTGWVSATNTVTVRLCVLTGSNVDAASASMRVDVVKQ